VANSERAIKNGAEEEGASLCVRAVVCVLACARACM